MLPTAFLGVLAALCSFVSASSASDIDIILKAQSLYPKCATDCLFDLVPKSDCPPTDVHCLCTNKKLTAETEKCLLANCSSYAALQTQNITMNMCGAPVRDKHEQPLIIALTMGSLALLAFIMRCLTLLMRSLGRGVGADDYFAGIAVLLAAPPTLTCFSFAKNGLGKDMWTLELDQIKTVLMLYYLGSVFYIASISAIKMSLLFFILRVFPDAKFRRICYGVMGLVIAYGIAFTVATALQCWPASYAWERIDDTKEGKCNNVHIQAWMAAIFNILLDLILLVLPLPGLWGLNMGIKKKLMIMTMFSLGIFVTIISSVRLHTLIKFANSQNITWDYVDAGTWSLVEMHVSIICACLPYCRHLLISFGANFLQSTQSDKSKVYGSRMQSSRKASDAAVLSVNKLAEGQQKPKHGDERDFVPLVEYPHRSWDKQTTMSASHAYDTDSV